MRFILVVLVPVVGVLKTYGQEIDLSRKIDFQLSEVTLAEAFRAFEEKSGIPAAYNSKILSGQKYSWTFVNEPLRNILNDITRVEELTFQIQEPSVLILKNPIDQAKQGAIRIEGKILNAETKEPVPFGHLLVEGTALGTVANMNGSFRLVIPQIHNGKMLVYSSVGYKNKRIQIDGSRQGLDVMLIPEILELNEVTVSAKKEKFDVNQLMREVVDQISNNYCDETVELNAYYREFMKLDNNYIQFADAATKINYSGYQTEFNRNKNFEEYLKHHGLPEKPKVQLPRIFSDLPDLLGNQVKIEEARVSNNLQRFQTHEFNKLDKRDLRILEAHDINNGPWHLLGFDHVKLRNELLSVKSINRFKFALADYIKLGNGYCYEISFKSRGDKSYPVAGTLFIEEDTKAILKIAYHSTAVPKNKKITLIVALDRKDRKTTGIRQSRLVRKVKAQNFNVTVEYFKYQNKYHLKRISEKATFLNTGEIVDDLSLQTQSDLVITDIQYDIDSISSEDKFKAGSSNFLSEYPLSYNPDFWHRYSGMVLDRVFQRALEDLEKTHSLEDQFSERFVQNTSLLPPQALAIPDTLEIHGDMRIDDYSWLRNKYSEPVERYLASENEYTRNYMIPFREKQRKFYYEMVDKTQSSYESLLTKVDDYYYGWRYEEGKPYEIIYRKSDTLSIEEEIVLDVNKMASGYDYYSVEDLVLSTNGNILAFVESNTGGKENVVRFKNITDKTVISDSLTNVGSLVWGNDNKTILYTQQDSTNRDCKLYQHFLGESQEQDKLLYEEKDRRFAIAITKSKSKKYLMLYTGSKDENEVHLLRADEINSQKLQRVRKREEGIKYYLKEYRDSFVILSDLNGGDYELFQARRADISSVWQQLKSYNSDTLITGMEVIGDYLILSEKVNMKPHIRIIDQLNGFQNIILLDSTDK